MRMSGNTMLITGGTSGIGLGLASRFHAEGNTVIIAGRRQQLLASITAEHPGMDSVSLDMADPTSIGDAIAGVFATHPDLDVVINNAGIMLPEELTDPRHLDVAEQTVITNLLGPIRLLTHVVPLLVAQPTATIINVSSGLAFVPLPLTPTYCATKAAIHSYTQSLRVQLADTGCPGPGTHPAGGADRPDGSGCPRSGDAAAGVPDRGDGPAAGQPRHRGDLRAGRVADAQR